MTDSPTAMLKSMQSTQSSSYVSTSPLKRKRKPAGTPDPDAEVIALSPKTLMESDRYVCEICNQGFQRDQNLQMHRRRHKVPWKLLKRADPEARKRVYVCPEPSCLHHNPCHALGDLVGIKKHYRRKHSSMKQWECDKCSKAYAVQSDYKAHLKTCGTRGHCCDCGRVFSRVETFIEHQDACSAASKKKTSAHASISDDQAALSLPSLATATAPGDHHATFVPSIPSNASEKVIKQDTYLRHRTFLMNVPFNSTTNDQESSAPASALPLLQPHTHSCIPNIPITSAPTPSFLLGVLPRPHTMPSAVTSAAACTPKVPPDTQQPRGADQLQPPQQTAELQLLPTARPTLISQLESSQSSNVCAWGREITSTNSITVCSSPCDHITLDHEKLALNNSGTCPAAAAAAVPCKLQLSIGLLHHGHQSSCKEDSSASTLQMSSQLVDPHEASDAEMLDCRIPDKRPWLACGAFPASEQQKLYDLRSENQCSSFLPMKTQAETIGHGYELANISLELANSAWHSDNVTNLEMQKKQDHDSFFGNKISASQSHVTIGNSTDSETSKMENGSGRADIDDENPLLGSPKLPAGMVLLRCNSLSGMSDAVVETADKQLKREVQTNSPSKQIMEESTGIQAVCQQSNFLLGADRGAPLLLAGVEHAELCLQRAKEKLTRALEKKVEAEKAWKEATRETEQAEAELAGVIKRLNQYSYTSGNMQVLPLGNIAKHVDEEVVRSRPRPTDDDKSSANSLIARSSGSLQVSSSSNSLQMQVNAGGVNISSSAPSFITCPSCHDHIQVLYHPQEYYLREKLFLPSQPADELPACSGRPAAVSNYCHSVPQPPSRSFNQK